MIIGSFNPISSKKNLNEIKKYGKIIRNDFFHLKYLKKNSNKIAFIISRKIGNAVVRNRIKRRVRNILNHYNTNDDKFNILFIVKQRFDELNYKSLCELINATFDNCYEKHCKKN